MRNQATSPFYLTGQNAALRDLAAIPNGFVQHLVRSSGMEFLDVGHNAARVVASVVIAIAAGFTGLTLSKDLAQQSVSRRKGSVAASAIALGGGIWSMHFVAMLGIQIPILFYYDAAITLASALLASLIVGTALLLLHFRERTPVTVCAAGA